METRFELNQSLDAALNRYVSNKNVAAYNQEKAKIEATLAKAKKEVADVITSVEKFEADLARKLREVEAKAERRVAAQAKLHLAEIGHKVDRKLAKADYEKSQPELQTAFSSLDQEIAGDVSDLTETM